MRWALDPAPGPRVLDLGAGTGKLTATLVALGADVIAVEPDPAMLTELRRALPTVVPWRGVPRRYRCRAHPSMPCWPVMPCTGSTWTSRVPRWPGSSRPAASWPASGGVVDNRIDWVAGLERVGGIAAIGPRDTLSNWRAETADAHLPHSGVVARFGSPEQAEFPYGHRRTVDSLVATLATKAGMLVMPEHERGSTLDRIRTFLASRPETSRGEFTLPMLTGVLRVRRS